MHDIQSLILHYMPAALRNAFVSAAVPHLDPGVRAIANADAKAAGFYAGLAIPLLVALYGADRTNPDGRLLNAHRAARTLGLDLQRDPVFLQQQEQLYRYRLASHFPRLKHYLTDQTTGADTYAPLIAAAAKALAGEITAQFDAAGAATGDPDRKAALAAVQTAAQRGQRGAFWAWALHRELLASVPSEFGPEALHNNAKPEDAALRIKQAVTLLDTLDASRFFSRSYLNYLASYTTIVNLAAKVDFDGNADALADYARAALTQFAAGNATSAHQHMRDTAEIAHHLVTPTGGGIGNDPLGAAFRAARDAATRLDSRSVTGAIETIAAKLTGTKTQPWLATAGAKDIATTLLKGALGAAALGLVISGGIALDGLPPEQRQRISLGIAASLSHSVALVARGSAHTIGFFVEHGVTWSKLSHSWGQWKVFDAQAVYTRGFAGWVLRNKEGAAAAGWQGQLRSLGMPGARYDYGHDRIKVSRIFGRNLDEFMAFRVGAVIGAINLYFAISALREASQPLEVATSAVSLAGASFGLIGSAGGWVCSAVGRFALAGQLSSSMSALAFAATIVVVALVIYQILNKPKATSDLRAFAQTDAAKAGYYMPLGAAIDYIAPADGSAGVTLRAGEAGYLRVDADGTPALTPTVSGMHGVFAVLIDSSGRTQLSTLGTEAEVKWILIATDNKVATRPASTATEPVFGWAIDVTGALSWTDAGKPSEALRSARVTIVVSGATPPRYLAVEGGRLGLSATAFPWTMARISSE